jgi:glycosyltransferase involved in cell wall biosynthesis
MARKDQATPRPKISAIVTTYNEEKNIGDCIRSLLWCDEIFVVDSFSTDRTPEIVRGFGDNVVFVQRTYYGSASQKNWAMDQVAHDWILIFDADERCLPKLQREIESLLARGPGHDAYTIHRRCFFLGKVLRFSGWQNDRVVRLVRKGTARYPNKRVHADMDTLGSAPVLKSSMDHYMADTLDEYIPRILKYSFWGAAQGWRDGKQSGFKEVWGRSVWRFFRTYFFQLGILDGMHGVVFCLLQAFGTYMKWALLWSWRVNAKRGVEPDLPVFDEDEDVWRDLGDEEAEADRIADREATPEPVRAGEE